MHIIYCLEGVRQGGNLLFRRNKIITKGLISNLPNSIELDISHLQIGMFIYIKDIDIEGCQFLAPSSSVVVGVKTARTVIEEVVEEEDATEEENESGESKTSDPVSEEGEKESATE